MSRSGPIPLRCIGCGNAVLRPRLEHEEHAREIAVSFCPACDEGGGFEETFYTDAATGEMLPWTIYMENRR